MFPSRTLRPIVPALIVFLPTLSPLAQTQQGPVPLPEGTWRPPSYSEQQRELPDVKDEPWREDPAETLTVLESPESSKWDATRVRFGRLLSHFAELCPHNPKRTASFADMLVTTHGLLKQAGLHTEEGLLSMSNTLYGITMDSVTVAGAHGFTAPQCSQTWSMYVSLRWGGQTSVMAREALLGVFAGIYGISGEGR